VQKSRDARKSIVSHGFDDVGLCALRLRAIASVRGGIHDVLGHHPELSTGTEQPHAGPYQDGDYIFGRSVIAGVPDATRASSTKPKFSLHIHTRIALTQHHADGAAMALSLNFACVTRLWYEATAPDTDDVTILLFALVWPWTKVPKHFDDMARAPFIDVNIYSRNRCLRMFAQSKLGDSRPLREVNMCLGCLIQLPSDPAAAWTI
jgi:hypothetical protein